MSLIYSVIVPVYNVEAYLRECVESVLSQTYSNWELILVDDGSTDSSSQICDGFSNKFGEKVRVVHQKNAGLLAARRTGFRAARGEVFVSLDSDDVLRSDALMKINTAFQSGKDVDIVAYGYSRDRDFTTMAASPFQVSGHFTRADLVRRSCVPPTLFSMCMKAIHRRVMDIDADYSAYFGLSFAEDLLQSLPVVDGVRGGYYIREPLYYYRFNGASITRSFDFRQIEEREIVHNIHLSYAKKWAAELKDTSLVSAVQAIGLKSYAETAQGVCEVMSRPAARRCLQEFSCDPIFLEYYELPGCLGRVRGDRRLVLKLLALGHFDCIWVISKFKAFIHRALGR